MSVRSALGGPYLDQMSGGSMTDYRSLAPYKRLQQQPVTMPDLSHTGIVGLASTNDFDQPKTTTARREWIRSASRALDDLARKEQRELMEKRARVRRSKRHHAARRSMQTPVSPASFMTQGRPSVEELSPSEYEYEGHSPLPDE